MIGIVVSRADVASLAIGDALGQLAEWEAREDAGRADGDGGGTYYRRPGFALREFDGLHLHLEDVADAFDDPDFLVFVSRHAGETGPLLTAHHTGNAGPADHGGRPNALSAACPNAHAHVLAGLEAHAPDGFDVGMECTHHGPTDVGAPSMFVEVGSAEAQWRDDSAARAAARAVLDLAGVSPHRERTVVGFGGGHYAPRFTRIVRQTDWAVGHVVADWSLEAAGELRPGFVAAVLEQSAAERALLDGDHPEIVEAIEAAGYRVVSETWLRETTDVSLPVVEAAEAALCSVDEGLRFGDRRSEALAVVTLHSELVREAHGTDPTGTRQALERHTVAFETEEGGNRPTGRLGLPGRLGLDPLADDLAEVLRDDGRTVERSDGALVVTGSRFDPDLARARGVSPGPAFGQLAEGEPVTVDGETVEPEAVHRRRTERYPIEDQSAEN